MLCCCFWDLYCFLGPLLFLIYVNDLPDCHLASLRADEIKLWLIPSAKQRRNPCSGLPAVYSLRSRCLEVVGEREKGRARGRHAKGLLLAHPFFLVPTTSKRLLRRLSCVPRFEYAPRLAS